MQDTLSDIVAALYRAAAGAKPWREALHRVGDSVGGAFTLIGIVDKAAGRTNSITSETFDPDRRETYRGRYFALNPRVAHSARTPVGEVFYDAAIAPDTELARHPYYAEYLAPRDFTHFISANLENGAGRRVNLSVQRSRRAGHVGKREVATMKAIVPHAIAAFELWENLQNASVQTRLLVEAFEALDAAVFVLDEAGTLVFANETGAALSGNGGPLRTDGHALTTADVAARDRFAVLVSAAQSRDGLEAALPGRMTLSATDGRRFQVSIRPLPDFVQASGAHQAGVLVVAEPVRPLSTADELQRLLGLTAGEAALALALADGARPQDYAEARAIAPETIQAQLSSLRTKLGASERGRAVSTVLRHAQRLQAAASSEAVLTVASGTNGRASTEPPWAEHYGLTPAEARLAAHLLDGGTTAGYAAARALSPHTVRNQLRSIYAKTNTNRQVSLLQLLLRASGKNP